MSLLLSGSPTSELHDLLIFSEYCSVIYKMDDKNKNKKELFTHRVQWGRNERTCANVLSTKACSVEGSTYPIAVSTVLSLKCYEG